MICCEYAKQKYNRSYILLEILGWKNIMIINSCATSQSLLVFYSSNSIKRIMYIDIMACNIIFSVERAEEVY